MEDKIAHKRALKDYCEQVVLQRIAITQQAMDAAQQAANQESKSSVGDKYETARAMSQLEKDMHARQLAAHQQDLHALRSVNAQAMYQQPAAGAFIRASTASFFICAGLGKQAVNGETVIFLSPYPRWRGSSCKKAPGTHSSLKERTPSWRCIES